MALIRYYSNAKGNKGEKGEFVKVKFIKTFDDRRCTLRITISEDLSRIFDLSNPSFCEIYLDDKDLFMLTLKKSVSEKGVYKLTRKGKNFQVSFTWPFTRPASSENMKVKYDIHPEGGLSLWLPVATSLKDFTPYPGG